MSARRIGHSLAGSDPGVPDPRRRDELLGRTVPLRPATYAVDADQAGRQRLVRSPGALYPDPVGVRRRSISGLPAAFRGPGDAVAALCGSEQFILGAMQDAPWFRPLLEDCAEVRLEVLQRLQELLPPWHGTCAAGGYPSRLWSKRTVCYYQDDSAALLNPRLYSELLLSVARRTKPAAEVHFIHLHSASLYMLDMLLADDTFAVIEVNLDHAGSGPPLAKYLPALRRVQQAGRPLLLWGEIDARDWTLLQGALQPTGLSIQPILRHPEEIHRYRWNADGVGR